MFSRPGLQGSVMANKKRRCRWCKTYGEPKNGVIINGTLHVGAYYCNAECSLAYALANIQKGRRLREKAHKAEKAASRRDDKPHQLELTRRVFNAFVRALDNGGVCPTCGEPLIDGRYDAGHVRTVASCPQLRFDPRACFGQCRPCNGSGTIRKKTRKGQDVVSGLYKDWILATYGQRYHDWLYGPHEMPHWSVDDLAAMRIMYAAETRRLESGQPPSRNWRALP